MRQLRKTESSLIWVAIGSAFVLSGYRIFVAVTGRATVFDRLQAYTGRDDLITDVLVFWSLLLLLFACYLWQSALRGHRMIQSVVNSVSPDVLMLVDADGRISMCNPAVEAMFGCTAGEVVGRKTDDFYLPVVGAEESPLPTRGQSLDDGYIVYAVGQRRDGKPLDLEIVTSYLRSGRGTVILARDVTEQRRAAELVLHAKEAAEESSRTKSRFLASMSHELRTPLNAVIGFSDSLLEQYFGPLNDKQREYVDHISSSGRHLLALINDILDIAKIEAGKLELTLGDVDVAALVEGSLVMIKERAARHGIELRAEGLDGLSRPTIRGDERKLKQILFNLLSNAAKFTPDGGRIRVETSERDDRLAIAVIDSGIGLAEADQQRIFDEFYQVEGDTTGKTPGTGLGLALTRNLVELHGGTIAVASDGLGHGSRFTVEIPLEAVEAAAATADAERTPADAEVDSGC